MKIQENMCIYYSYFTLFRRIMYPTYKSMYRNFFSYVLAKYVMVTLRVYIKSD